MLFHEYFHAEIGRGGVASHQTGWTALVATLLDGVVRQSKAVSEELVAVGGRVTA
ncbi:MAG: hypothetical protein HOP15_14220 [Planctomycetes bacterium]|nr:hypothetical protein [Planctomycetota bacterium]